MQEKKLPELRKRIIRNEYTQQFPKLSQGWGQSELPTLDKIERHYHMGHHVESAKGYYPSKG